jgi:homoserine acetyltransferase
MGLAEPASANPAAGKVFGLDLFVITIRDIV